MQRKWARLAELLAKRRWPEARRILLAELKKKPDSHWHLTRLSWVAACQRRGGDALRYSKRALASEPNCPLVLWDYAGALHVVQRSREAHGIYRRLIRRGVGHLGCHVCGAEGPLFARGLIADCHAQLARGALAAGRRTEALRGFRRALAVKRPAGRRVNPLPELRQLVKQVEGMQSPSVAAAVAGGFRDPSSASGTRLRKSK